MSDQTLIGLKGIRLEVQVSLLAEFMSANAGP